MARRPDGSSAILAVRTGTGAGDAESSQAHKAIMAALSGGEA